MHVIKQKNCINEYDIGKTRCCIPKYHEKRPSSGNVESAGYTMVQNTKWRLSCQDGGRIQNGVLAVNSSGYKFPPYNSIPNNGWKPKYYSKLASMLKRNVRCDIELVSVRCGSTVHPLPTRTTFEVILTPHVHSRAEHISSSHKYRRHQSSGNCGIIGY